MFFIMGINQGRKEIAYDRMIICNHCGSYGRYQVFMIYMYLSLFFIPCFKWKKQFYVQTTCCNTIYELDPEVGKALARGENIEIRQEYLREVRAGFRSYMKRCSNCGYETQEDFEFCPKCGKKF